MGEIQGFAEQNIPETTGSKNRQRTRGEIR
jgi:hypothetical protein